MAVELDELILSDNIEVHTKHKWGYELWLANTELYCAKLLVMNKGIFSSSMHQHRKKDETFTLLSGRVDIEYETEEGDMRIAYMWPGDSLRIKPGRLHRFTNRSDTRSVIHEVSTHHEDSDTYRVEKNGGQ